MNHTRSLPHNLEAERKVLGAMMHSIEAAHLAQEMLGESSFYQPSHQIIYNELTKLSEKNNPIDLVTLSNALEKQGKLEVVGGMFYLAELAQSVATTANVEFHAAIVQERAKRRSLIKMCTQAIHEAHENALESPEAIAASIQQNVIQFADIKKKVRLVGDDYIDFLQEQREIQQRKLADPYAITGISTGIKDLDKILGGLKPSTLNLVGGRPKQGKSCLVGQIDFHAASIGKNVAEFILEMPFNEIRKRHISRAKGVNFNSIVSEKKWAELTPYQRIIEKIPLQIFDDVFSWREIQSKIRRLHIQKPLDLVTIDYVQRIKHSTKTATKRDDLIAEISSEAKKLAMELNIPFIMVAALNRESEKRANKGQISDKPKLSDLRECGSLEYDCDTATFIYHEINREDGDEKLKSYLVVAANRDGECGDVPVYFRKEHYKFEMKTGVDSYNYRESMGEEPF